MESTAKVLKWGNHQCFKKWSEGSLSGLNTCWDISLKLPPLPESLQYNIWEPWKSRKLGKCITIQKDHQKIMADQHRHAYSHSAIVLRVIKKNIDIKRQILSGCWFLFFSRTQYLWLATDSCCHHSPDHHKKTISDLLISACWRCCLKLYATALTFIFSQLFVPSLHSFLYSGSAKPITTAKPPRNPINRLNDFSLIKANHPSNPLLYSAHYWATYEILWRWKQRVCFVNTSVAQCIAHLFLYGRIGFHDCFLILPAGYIKCLQTPEHFVQETNNYSQSEHMATTAIWEKRWGSRLRSRLMHHYILLRFSFSL